MTVANRRLSAFLFLAVCFFPSSLAAAHLVLDYNSRESASLAETTLKSIIAGNTTEPAPDSWMLKGYASLSNRTQLDDAIRAVPETISELNYRLNVPINAETLKALQEAQPACRLYYDIPFSYRDRYDKRVPRSVGSEPFHREKTEQHQMLLGQCSSLYSIRAHMNYGSEDNFDDMPFVFDILTACPNVKELDLAISHFGCVVSHYETAFDFTRNNKSFVQLESLKLDGYHLHYTPTGESRYGAREFAKSNTPNVLDKLLSTARLLVGTLYRHGLESGFRDFYNFMADFTYQYQTRTLSGPEYDNLDVWLQRMDWSRLKHLDLGSAGLNSLKRIVANGASPESLVLPSIYRCACEKDYSSLVRNLSRPLEHLEVEDVEFTDYNDIVDAIGSRGDSLRILILREGEYNRHEYCSSRPSEEHCPETFGTYYLPRPFLNASQLQQLSKQNTNITTLDTDISRIVPDIENRSTWSLDYTAIEAASMLPQLTNLKLNIESPDHHLIRAGRMSEHKWTRRLGDNKELPASTDDPSLNRTSVPALFSSINQSRQKAGLASLERLVLNIGRWEQRQSDWGMMGPPELMIGNWICEIVEGELQSRCYSGNAHLGHDDVEMEDPYSEDWGLPDPVFRDYRDDEGWYDHSEL